MNMNLTIEIKNAKEVGDLLDIIGIKGNKKIAFVKTNNFIEDLKKDYRELYKEDVDYFIYYYDKLIKYDLYKLVDLTERMFNFAIVYRIANNLLYFYPIK